MKDSTMQKLINKAQYDIREGIASINVGLTTIINSIFNNIIDEYKMPYINPDIIYYHLINSPFNQERIIIPDFWEGIITLIKKDEDNKRILIECNEKENYIKFYKK